MNRPFGSPLAPAPRLLTALLLLLGSCSTTLAQTPTSFDWRNVGGVNYVSGVRNIGSCASAYIFAPVAMVESRQMIAAGRLGRPVTEIDYSEQYLLSCGTGPSYGAFGCNGGFPSDVLGYMRDVGVPLEACMIYRAVDGTCPSHCPDTGQPLQLFRPVVSSAVQDAYPGEQVLRQEIYDNGPVVVWMDVYSDLYNYSAGVYSHASGGLVGSTVVLIVGWGDAGGTGYWIVKNSWDTWWGEDGYVRVARANQGNCDVAHHSWTSTVSAPVVSVESSALRAGLMLQNRPNPFGPVTVIRYRVRTDAPVALHIHDAAGRRVVTLVHGAKAAGDYETMWDGRDQGGRRVARGVYYCRLEVGGHVETRSMILAD